MITAFPLQAFPGMVPYKRPAADKSGVPVYQPNATTYQQLMQLQQPFVPVSCEYSTTSTATTSTPVSPTSSPSSTTPSLSVGVGGNTESSNSITKAAGTANSIADGSEKHQSNDVTAKQPSASNMLVSSKDLSQQNFMNTMKAVSATAATASLTINPLTALSYTGVALNKQAVKPRYPTPQQYPILNQGLTTLARPPTMPATIPHTFFPPFSLIPGTRPQLIQTLNTPFAIPQQPATGMVNNSMLTQYTPFNNSNVLTTMSLQPYKKMKTI